MEGILESLLSRIHESTAPLGYALFIKELFTASLSRLPLPNDPQF